MRHDNGETSGDIKTLLAQIRPAETGAALDTAVLLQSRRAKIKLTASPRDSWPVWFPWALTAAVILALLRYDFKPIFRGHIKHMTAAPAKLRSYSGNPVKDGVKGESIYRIINGKDVLWCTAIYTHDKSAGTLTRVMKDQQGTQLELQTYKADLSRYLLTLEKKDNCETAYELDEKGQIQKITYKAFLQEEEYVCEQSFEYDALGRQTKRVAREGAYEYTMNSNYSADGKLELVEVLGSENSFHVVMKPVVEDKNGETITTERFTFKDEDSGETMVHYGKVTTRKTDDKGRLIREKIIFTEFGDAEFSREIFWEYDLKGTLLKQEVLNKNYGSAASMLPGNPSFLTDYLNDSYREINAFEYDSFGRLKSRTFEKTIFPQTGNPEDKEKKNKIRHEYKYNS